MAPFLQWLICIAAFLGVAGCGSEPGPAREIEVFAAAGDIGNDGNVVRERLRNATPQRLWDREPTYRVTRNADRLRIEASATPPEEELRYLLSHRGEFEVRGEFGPSWFDHRHVVDAQASLDESGQARLLLRLSDEGRDRVALFSRTRTPTVVQVMFDRRQVAVAQVRSPITEGRVEVPLTDRSPKDALLMAQILRTGPLSFQPGEVRIRRAEPAASTRQAP